MGHAITKRFGNGGSGTLRTSAERFTQSIFQRRVPATTTSTRSSRRRSRAIIKRPVLPGGARKRGPERPSGVERISEAPRRVSAPSRDFLIGNPPAGTISQLPAPTAPTGTIETQMSIHKKLGGIFRQAIIDRTRAVLNPVRTAAPGGVSQANILALPPVVAAGGRAVLPVIGRAVAAFGAGVTVGSFFARNDDGSCPVGTHPIKQDGVHGPKGSYCVRNRRMNVGNARAARRSVRRLKGSRKLLRDIEKMMPTRTTRRRAPEHHHHPRGGVV